MSHSVAFGVRKSLMSEQGKGDMEERIDKLLEEKRDLEQQVYLTHSPRRLMYIYIHRY